MSDDTNVRVFLTPFFEENQYQQRLKQGLESRGARVMTGAYPLPLRPFVHEMVLKDVDVLHLHWTHPYFLFGSKRRFYAVPFAKYFCAFAAAFFVLQVYLATHLTETVVWTAHNKCNHERRYEELDRWVNRWVVRLVDDVHVWDEATRDELVAYLEVTPNHTTVVPHGNYVDRYAGQTVSKETARDRLGVAEYERVFLYFGRIRPYKGVPKLIDVFADVGTDETCLIVAGTPMYDDLRREIERAASGVPNVELELEYIPDDDVPLYFGACDFAVFPYEHVFNSGSVVLAMSLGRAFVAPRQGSIPSVSPDGNVLYDDLHEGLRTAQETDAAMVESVGRLNESVARRDHDWSSVVDRTIASYTR